MRGKKGSQIMRWGAVQKDGTREEWEIRRGGAVQKELGGRGAKRAWGPRSRKELGRSPQESLGALAPKELVAKDGPTEFWAVKAYEIAMTCGPWFV